MASTPSTVAVSVFGRASLESSSRFMVDEDAEDGGTGGALVNKNLDRRLDPVSERESVVDRCTTSQGTYHQNFAQPIP